MKLSAILRVRPASLALLGASLSASAATFTANFDNGLVPPGSQIFGNAAIETTGGVDNSGALKLTKAEGSQQGSFVIDDLDFGSPVYGFRASMMVRVGGGTVPPADGWSFCVSPDLPDGTWSEEGTGSGLIFAFDTYTNEGEDAPEIDLKVAGQTIVSIPVPIQELITGNAFVPLNIMVHPDGALDLNLNGKDYFTQFYFPNYQPLYSPRYGLGARTGGATANHFIDQLELETFLTPEAAIVAQPQDLTVIEGYAATFNVGVQNRDVAEIQWLRDGVVIPGQTDVTYTLDPTSLGDNGAKFSVQITTAGPTFTSDEATLQVKRLDLPGAPVLSFDFDDANTPAGTTPYGSAYVWYEGVDASGGLILTDYYNDQGGAFIIDDPHAGAPVYGLAARFRLAMRYGTEPPADGFSFNFGSDMPVNVDLITGMVTGMVEEGVGNGLMVCFDAYDNGGGEAPAITLKWNGAVVAEVKVSATFLETEGLFAEVLLRLTSDGKFDLAWDGMVLFDRVPVPAFSSIAGGSIGLYARTGGAYQQHVVDEIQIFTDLEPPQELRFAAEPQPVVVLVGRSATFSAAVSPSAGATYQWFRNGDPIPGAVTSTYVISATAAADDGARFKVQVQNIGQTLTSAEALLTVVDLTPPAEPQIAYDFNNGQVPAGAQVTGTALVEVAGGLNNTGALRLTIAANEQNGGFLSPIIENGAQILGFTLAFDALVGNGTSPPADGFSVSIAHDLPLTVGEAENGGGTGITVAFDIFDNGGGEAPSIDIRYQGQEIVSTKLPYGFLDLNDTYATVLVRVSAEGRLDLAFGDTVVYHNLEIPGYTPGAQNRIAFYGRTGGLNAEHWIDNVRLAVSIPIQLAIAVEPADTLVLEGRSARFGVQVSNPAGVTYQWFRGGVLIPGATGSTYTTPPLNLSDEGAGYSVEATGPNNTATSRTAIARVMAAFEAGASPAINLTFNDGLQPSGTYLVGNPAGTAYVSGFGGVNNSGMVVLTDAANGLTGSFLVDTPAGAEPFTDFTATWRMRVGGGTVTPADGFSFVLGADVGNTTAFGETGAGSGLVVSFDTYNNATVQIPVEAPGIDVFYKGVPVAARLFPIEVLRTGDAFVTVGVRVNRNGTLDLYYGDTAVFRRLRLPDYEPFGAGRFGWGARTGGLNDNHWLDEVRIALNIQEPETILEIRRELNGNVTIQWDGPGTLESTDALPGGWSEVAGFTRPYTIPPTERARFYRVRQ